MSFALVCDVCGKVDEARYYRGSGPSPSPPLPFGWAHIGIEMPIRSSLTGTTGGPTGDVCSPECAGLWAHRGMEQAAVEALA